MKLAVYEGMPLGQIELTFLGQKYHIPVKVRVSGNLIPDFTIDPIKLAKRRKRTGGLDLMSLLNLRVIVLIGNKAYEIDSSGKIKPADPKIFEQPTFLDQIADAGVIPTIVFVSGTLFFFYRMIRAIRG